MKASLRMAAAWLALAGPATAQFLVGYGFDPYEPLCAESRRPQQAICTAPRSNECYASNTPFLTSVAWCFSTKCAEFNIPASTLQAFWEKSVTGSSKVAAKWTYPVALAQVEPPPTYQLNGSEPLLNVTSLVSPDTYLRQWNVLGMVAREGVVESKYSIAIFVVAVGVPILFTWLGYMPFVHAIVDKIKPYLVYPSLIGKFQVQPLPFRLGNAPTVGQGLYIALFIGLNVILSAVDYQSAQPNAWYNDQWHEISAYVLYRTGTFGFMLLPILLLFASRNNILLWFSNWSHSTYLLLHRWVARVFTLYVVIHSCIGLQIYAHNSQTEWWIWGAVATIATVALALVSGLYVRASQYELFLISHVVLSVFVVAGCWYHIFGWYASMGIFAPSTWGYEIWVYFGIAVWAFDRLFRLGRVLKNGARRAHVTALGDGYIRVDIPSVRWAPTPGQHAYVYFPTLAPLRPWENHPFSIIPTPTTGITLLIKQSAGLTRHLQPRANLLALLDGPYTNCPAPSSILRCDRVLLVAGGIGITGLLPWARAHWNVKLAWSVAEAARCLADAVDLSWLPAGVEREVRVGRRFDVAGLVEQEAASGWGRVGVVVSGPGGCVMR
ncbi:hypothetical protein NEMBOFW57_008279 [Staphylotrichum longicolle]|uniref:FAD-binding FR-type domain-containing protein n=1 Tax=Staphylotrichum longicolle TaxID=669026 RepID=A0AAD4EV96_9PEZI|nr:hypothetical protein NEMBOFW57_008279 [Staphylotrichum longicolle]